MIGAAKKAWAKEDKTSIYPILARFAQNSCKTWQFNNAVDSQNTNGPRLLAAAHSFKSNLSPIATVESLRE
jgi:hypothetical protein